MTCADESAPQIEREELRYRGGVSPTTLTGQKTVYLGT